MFDFAWSELAVIGVVALLVIGPKDLPVAIKTVGDFVRKARRMAGEFQTHVDDMVKDADLQNVKNQINEIRNFDFKGAVEKQLDGDGSIRNAFSDPLATAGVTPAAPPAASEPAAIEPAPVAAAPLIEQDTTPAFIPPAIAHPPVVPDFLPPGIGRA